MMFKLIGCLILFCAFNLQAGNIITDSTTGVTFPTEVSFNYLEKEYQLEATGVSAKKKMFFKVYSVAHYLQKGAELKGDRFHDILNDANANQLVIKWVRDVDALDLQEGYEESLLSVIPAPISSRLRASMRAFVAIFHRNVAEGEEHVIRWIPGGIVEVFINGYAAGKITNPELAKGLWSIWFGPESVVNRDELISMMR